MYREIAEANPNILTEADFVQRNEPWSKVRTDEAVDELSKTHRGYRGKREISSRKGVVERALQAPIACKSLPPHKHVPLHKSITKRKRRPFPVPVTSSPGGNFALCGNSSYYSAGLATSPVVDPIF